MDIYGSLYADEGSGAGTTHMSMYMEETHADTGDDVAAGAAGVGPGADCDPCSPSSDSGNGAVEPAPAASSVETSSVAERRVAAPVPAAAGGEGRAKPKPDFSVISKYQWGSYAGGDALQGDAGHGAEADESFSDEEGEEVECCLDGEDDIVLLGPLHTQAPQIGHSRLGSLGSGIYRVANHTAQKAGDVVYYATNSVSEKSSALMIEAKATLSRGSDVAVVSLAGGAAAETLLFAVDRSRLLGMQLVHSLRGDPEVARRLHLRRLLASGSWAEFSAKCQLATLPWYTRQLIHLTRYDSKVTSRPSGEHAKESRGKKLARASASASQGSHGPGAAASGAAVSSRPHKNRPLNVSAAAASYPSESERRGGAGAEGEMEDPMQMDTLLLNEADVQYLNGATRQAASDAQDRKEETAGLTDKEFHQWILAKAQEGSADAEYALSKWFTPPSFTESGSCYACRISFGISKFRHHCRHCGHSFCGEHSSETRSILKYGFTSPVRVCDTCAYTIDRESRMDRQMWKQERLTDYAHSALVPYFEAAEDRGVDKAYR
jgi:hypothetical protein